MKWVIALDCEKNDGGYPEWLRTIALRSDGEVFVPALIAGDESAIGFYCLVNDIDSYLYNDHLYVPADWMSAEHPETREECEQMVTEGRKRSAL